MTMPIQFYAFTGQSVPNETYVRFLQAFKLPNGNVELRIRNGDGLTNTIEITVAEALSLSISLGAAKFSHLVVSNRMADNPAP